MSSCYFCSGLFVKQTLFDHPQFWVMWDAHPVTPGHVLILPKEHMLSLTDLPPEEWGQLASITREIVATLKHSNLTKVYQELKLLELTPRSGEFIDRALATLRTAPAWSGDFNFGVNNGVLAGRSINHLLFHFIPRFEGDVPEINGGLRSIIAYQANYQNPT